MSIIVTWVEIFSNFYFNTNEFLKLDEFYICYGGQTEGNFLNGSLITGKMLQMDRNVIRNIG